MILNIHLIPKRNTFHEITFLSFTEHYGNNIHSYSTAIDLLSSFRGNFQIKH